MEVVESDSNSSESLYEIRLKKFVGKDEISSINLSTLVVRCSACGQKINQHSENEVKKHRKLDVITCNECYEFYGSSEFSQDESGYKYCTWCGNGGKLIMCDYCPNCFCNACITRNFGRAEIAKTSKKGWKCYVCDAKCLKPKKKFCDLILSYKDKTTVKKEKKTPITTKIDFSEEWLEMAFDESEKSCKIFCKNMSKLRSIGINKKKSLKHIVKKLEEVIKDHKTSLKNITNTVNQKYASHIERQQAAELEYKNTIETLDNSIDDEKSKQSHSECIIEDDAVEKNQDGEMSDESFSLNLNKDKSKTYKANKTKKLTQEINFISKTKRSTRLSSTDSAIKVSDACGKEPIEKGFEIDIKSNNHKIDVDFLDASSSDSVKPLILKAKKRKKLIAHTNLKSNKKRKTKLYSESDYVIEKSDAPVNGSSEKCSETDDKSKNKVNHKRLVNFSGESNSDSDKSLINKDNEKETLVSDTNLKSKKRNSRHSSSESAIKISDTSLEESIEKNSEMNDKSKNHRTIVNISDESSSDTDKPLIHNVKKKEKLASDTNLKSDTELPKRDSAVKVSDTPGKEPTEKSSEIDDKSKNHKIDGSLSDASSSGSYKPLVSENNESEKLATDTNLKSHKKRKKRLSSSDSAVTINDILVKESEKSSKMDDKSKNHKIDVSFSDVSSSDSDKPLIDKVKKKEKLASDTNLKSNTKLPKRDSAAKVSDTPLKEPTEEKSEIDDNSKNHKIDGSLSDASSSGSYKPLVSENNEREKLASDTNLKSNKKINIIFSSSDSDVTINDVPVKENSEKTSKMDDKSENHEKDGSYSDVSSSDSDKPLIHKVKKKEKLASDSNLKSKKRNARHSSSEFSVTLIDSPVQEPSEKSSKMDDKSKNHNIDGSLSDASSSDICISIFDKIKEKEKLSSDTNLKNNKKRNSRLSICDSIFALNDISIKEQGSKKSLKTDDHSKNSSMDVCFSEESSSDFDIGKPDVDQLVEEVDKQVEKEVSEDESITGKLGPDNDSKLKLQSKVELIRCDHLLRKGEESMLISEDSDIEDKLDKLEDSLCKFPRNKYFKAK